MSAVVTTSFLTFLPLIYWLILSLILVCNINSFWTGDVVFYLSVGSAILTVLKEEHG